MLRIETGLTLVAILIACIRPTIWQGCFGWVEGQFSKFSRNPVAGVVAIGVLALVTRAALLPIEHVPEPVVHDEFGYLLAADTFTHGKVTNPTHPMWTHFESFSILQRPTYQCFAQPGQGLILAFGKVLFGHPFWGVWLSVGLMCASITWMLQGWLAPEWAVLGGILTIIRYGTFSYWANSYWGGALGAVGGALVLGALPRIKTSHRVRDAVLMGLGLVILSNTRPYEGLVFSIPIAIFLLIWILRNNRATFQLVLRRVVFPLLLVLAMNGVWLGYYFWRVTGSPVHMPYQIERQTYAIVPYMRWQHVRAQPVYSNAVMKKMYAEKDLEHYQRFKSTLGLIAYGIVGWSFFVGPALTLPIAMLPFALPRDFSLRAVSRSTAFLLIESAAFVAGSLLEVYYNPHYSAPATGLILLLILLATQQLRRWSPIGKSLSRAMPIICVLTFTIRAAAGPLHLPLHDFYEFAWHQKGAAEFGRAKVLDELHRTAGRHLVLVSYKPDHDPFDEWVYNDANIDAAKIVWARELSPQQDSKLLEYFKGRQVWILRADDKPPQLVSFSQIAGTEHQCKGRLATSNFSTSPIQCN